MLVDITVEKHYNFKRRRDLKHTFASTMPSSSSTRSTSLPYRTSASCSRALPESTKVQRISPNRPVRAVNKMVNNTFPGLWDPPKGTRTFTNTRAYHAKAAVGARCRIETH